MRCLGTGSTCLTMWVQESHQIPKHPQSVVPFPSATRTNWPHMRHEDRHTGLIFFWALTCHGICAVATHATRRSCMGRHCGGAVHGSACRCGMARQLGTGAHLENILCESDEPLNSGRTELEHCH